MLRSLKATLMMWVVLLIALVVPLRSVLDVRNQLARTDAAFDSALSDWSLALGRLVRMGERGVQFDINQQTEQSLRTTAGKDSIYYVVLGPENQWIAGDVPLAAPPVELGRGEHRLLDTKVGDQALRMSARALDCGAGVCQVRVAETLREREQTRLASVSVTALLASGAALLLALAIWLVVSAAMRPLASLNEQLAQRSLDDLRPLRRGRLPAEIKPLVDAIDQLLKRVAADAGQQRHFIADAAHQLRTPLTALRTESELALLEQHPAAVHATLQRIHRSAHRAARLADQLLALARTEALSRAPGRAGPVDLKTVAQDAAQDWVPRALERGADLGFQLEAAALVGRHHLLGELLGNLVHNALEYGGGGGDVDGDPRPVRITVRTVSRRTPQGARALLEVEDNGPGIAAAERERVFERFYRSPGSVGTGSGLGLAIVRDIALAHGAEVRLCDAEEGSGLCVQVLFPAIV